MIGKQPLFDKLQRATKLAFDRVGRIGNVEPDADLRLYNTLKSENFTDLMKEYGEQPILDYIKEMEFRKVNRRK